MDYLKMTKEEKPKEKPRPEVKEELNLKGNSEFLANCHLTLHVKDKQPSPDGEEIKIKKGEAIPEIFIPNFITHNRAYIANLPIENGIPQLTKEQEKKYELSFVKAKPKTFSEEVEKYYPKHDLESLKNKLTKYIKKNGSKMEKDKLKN